MRIYRAIAVVLTAFAATISSLCVANTFDEAKTAYEARDYAQAMSIAMPLARDDNASAQYLVGLMNWRGRGAARDDAVAIDWLSKAADQNLPAALNDLATMHQEGSGTAKDAKRAFELFERAAELGSAAGQMNTAKAYQDGNGVTKSVIRARFWYEQADATMAQASRITARRGERVGQPPSAIPQECRPRSPPITAMRKLGIREASGNIAFVIDAEGKVRGVTAETISAHELRYEAVAFFSESLRAKACSSQTWQRESRYLIPFKFVMTG